MGLRLFADAGAFRDALAGSADCLYAICNRDQLDPGRVLELERCGRDRKHRDLPGIASLREDASRELHQFFREAAQLDPHWLFAYSSKVVLSLPELQDLQNVFLLRAHFHARSQPDVLMLVADPRLRRLFAELFTGAPPARELARPTARAWGRFFRTLMRALANRQPRADARVLVFSLSSGAPASNTDAYFGNLAEALSTKTPTLTVYLASGAALRLPRSSTKAPFEAFVSALDVIRAWTASCLSGRRAIATGMTQQPPGKLAPLHRYVRATELRLGEYFMQRLLERGFKRVLERVSPEVLVYPFENRSWEKHLLAAAHDSGVKRRIAYQHSSITPRHLAFRIEDRDIPAEYLPDEIVTIGECTADLLRTWAPSLASRVSTGASLRTAAQTVAEAKAPGVLVAISSSRNEALRLLQITHAAATRVSLPFIVRTHPTIPVDGMFALFTWPPNVELSAGRSLAEDLSRVTLVAYSSATVALEGMLYGRLPIFVEIGDLPSGDPILGDHPFKFTAHDGERLADAVERASTLDPERLRILRSEARAFAERYLRTPGAEAVERMSAIVLS